jgi:hypothetical protein
LTSKVFDDIIDLSNEREVLNMKIWYAVMKDVNDDDWGYGSYDLGEAVAMLNQEGYEEGFILAIDDDTKVALEVVEI